MGVICVKFDDKFDQFMQELTEDKKQKMLKVLSAEANYLLAVMTKIPPENLDEILIFLERFRQNMFKTLMQGQDDFDSNNDDKY